MRTPVLLVAGQELTDALCEVLVGTAGTVVVTHRFTGHVVIRGVTIRRGEQVDISEWPLELSNCCVGCTSRDDLLVLLRRLHRRDDVDRIVVHLDKWLEPEPVCWAINNVDVHVGPGYLDGPAAQDVRIEAVVSTVNTEQWLAQAVGDDVLDDDRTEAQVVVAQAEFADLLVLTDTDSKTLAVLNRLAPRARFMIDVDNVETALTELAPDARRGNDHSPHEHLLAGRPPLDAHGDVAIVEFNASRPFHPLRLHLAIDDLLDGVVRVRGRAWLASQPDTVIWIESAGGGLRVAHAGQWLATMDPDAWAEDPERVALASMRWDEQFGDRHIAMTVLVCGADPDTIFRSLSRALLTDEELSRPLEWPGYEDPFQEWHEDPCEDLDKVDESRPDGSEFGFS
ncbi:ribosome hibernation factor-recruiting GTPase MRF [Mycobacterium sp. SMC-4]|uniref:ribosome hibernation factor-recruiting GTPase MRF n=1 Tax=Mycobacterium sp. SMC-4 TaxID=2857059 RepID=UPI0021B29F79|nr:GTP-binding protein [Mycobacterium sp. SMC-4]UXA17596.1 cobalamin biosynthesis protein CobW [Mycobacterium sp. SMC-4]